MKYFVVTKPFVKSQCRYFTMKNKMGASRILAFDSKELATSFKKYAVYHRSAFGSWPVLDASNTDSVHLSSEKCKLTQLVDKHVHVIGWEDVDFSVPFITGTFFKFDEELNVHLRLTENTNAEIDLAKTRCMLEKLF